MKELVGEVPGILLGLLMDLLEKLRKGVITIEELKMFLRRENPFSEQGNPYKELLREWQKFYAKVFKIILDLSEIKIPAKPGEGWRLLIIADGMTPECLYSKCWELFGVWRWTNDNLDKIVISNRTTKDGHYAIWVRDRQEADEEFKDLSANSLKNQNHESITLEERLIFELKFFKETGKRLDVLNVTLCAGSRYSDGRVPRVGWYDDEMGVRLCSAGDFGSGLRSRQVVF
jgi:hypothetical protein